MWRFGNASVASVLLLSTFSAGTLTSLSSPIAFAGGGFGASKAPAAKKKKVKKGRGSLLDSKDISRPKPKASEGVVVDGPKLDRFGLPPPTEEDILPPLPPGTELIPVGSDYQTKTDDVRAAMKNYISLNYDIFDEHGVEKVPLANDGEKRDPMKLRMLNQSPPVLAIDNFFSKAECEEYMRLSNSPEEGSHDQALMVDSKTFALSMATRTSTTWFCHYRQVPALLAKATRLLNDIPIERIEEPQLVRYRTGEEFSWHYDEIPPPQLPNGGQRVATLLVYMETLEEGKGGATEFRDLVGPCSERLAMRPVQGSALLFFPALADGTPDDRTLHKGEVAVDEKMIGQIWIHEREYKPAVPDGNSHASAKEALELKRAELGYQ